MADAGRERLIEILKLSSCPSLHLCNGNCKYANFERCHEERMADLLLEHGVIALPCKVGDTVYRITRCSCEDIDGAHTECEFYGFGTDDKICELPNDMKCPYKLRVASCNVTEMNIFMFAKEWESATFPTRGEAERALKEREENG